MTHQSFWLTLPQRVYYYIISILLLELKDSAASTQPDGVTIARCSTMSLANDLGDIGFLLGVSPMISAYTSRRRRLLSMSSIMLLVWWREKCK